MRTRQYRVPCTIIDVHRRSPSMNLRAMNLSTSSSSTTGMEIFITAIHSVKLSGVIWKIVDRMSTYRMTKCNDIDNAIAPINHMFVHGGMTRSDWFSDRLQCALVFCILTRHSYLFIALSISIVTNTDSAIAFGWLSYRIFICLRLNKTLLSQ